MENEISETSRGSKNSLFIDKLVIVIYYFVALSISVLSLIFIPISNIFLRILVADIISTIFIYIISVIYKNTSIYDPYWSVYPIFILFYWVSFHYGDTPSISVKQVIVIVLVCIWGIRLTSNWAKYWGWMNHEDWRYKMYRVQKPKNFQIINFFGLQMMPTLWVFLGSMSLYPALKPNTPISILDYIAIIITVNAIIFEIISDIQMHRFLETKKPGENIESGLWKNSRHPNYFGEVTFWWGLWLFGISSDMSYWWTIVGPIAITLLFIFISIPMMEKRNLKKRPNYAEYQKTVSMIIPWKRKEV